MAYLSYSIVLIIINSIRFLIRQFASFSAALKQIDALISEINQSSCYEMIEQFCDLILNQLPSLRKKRYFQLF